MSRRLIVNLNENTANILFSLKKKTALPNAKICELVFMFAKEQGINLVDLVNHEKENNKNYISFKDWMNENENKK